MTSGIEVIAKERQRQIQQKGFNKIHDSQYKTSALNNAAICYAIFAGSSNSMREAIRQQVKFGHTPGGWPWDLQSWKPSDDNCDSSRIRELAKAGALIAAEIDRLKRKAS